MSYTYDAPVPGSALGVKETVASTGRFHGFPIRRLLAGVRGPAAGKELPDFTRQLATLLKAGSNTPAALEALVPDIQSPALREAVEALELATKRGLPLNKAMRAHPRIFDRVYTEIVAAGEQAGTPMEDMLDPLAAGLVTAEKIRSKIARAMIQPMFTLGATCLGGWYMIQTVVPTFAGIYEREGVDLPLVTRLLIELGNVAATVGDGALFAAGIGLLSLPKILASPAVRTVTDRMVLRIPIIGPLQTLGSVARFMRFFSMLLSTKTIHEAEAIQLAAQTAPNSAIAARLAAAAENVAAGTKNVSGALERTGVVPRIYIQILRTGEASGELPELTAYAAERLEERVMSQVEKAQEALIPLVMLIVIGVVALMMVALYGPMAGLYKVLLS
jgi:type IV pilus assembly protein PilC